MRKVLFVCNTVYQILIASWIKYDCYRDDEADILVSDHMNNSREVAENIRKTGLFSRVYDIETKPYAFEKKRVYHNQIGYYYYSLFSEKELRHYVQLKERYDELFISNYDRFNFLLFDVLKRRNKKLVLNVFEDGIATYSESIHYIYNESRLAVNPLKQFILYHVCRKKTVFGNVRYVWVLTPSLLEWLPEGAQAREIRKIDTTDTAFLSIVNQIFNYASLEDTYEERYIFFEESFYASEGFNEDVELIERLAERFGKENMLIKIHPRNPVNRFKEKGYKTNRNTAIPWEVIAMNIDLSDKVLITVSSSSIVNPKALLGKHVKAVSLVNCLKNKPKALDSAYCQSVFNFFRSDSNIVICNSIRDIKED